MRKKKPGRVRELVLAYVMACVYDKEVVQRDPYTFCNVEAAIAVRGQGVHIYVGVGFSKRQEPDEWDPAFGASLARLRAMKHIAAQFRKEFPGEVERIVGQ